MYPVAGTPAAQGSSLDIHGEIELDENRSETFQQLGVKTMMRQRGQSQRHRREQRQKVKRNDDVANEIPKMRERKRPEWLKCARARAACVCVRD